MKNKLVAAFMTAVVVISAITCVAFADSAVAGDVNGDKAVTPADARLTLRCSAMLEEFDDGQFLNADVSAPFGKITAADARLILRVGAKLETLPEAPTTKPSEPTTNDPTKPVVKYPAVIGSFLGGKFYLDGVIADEDGETPVKIASNGVNFEIAGTIDDFGFSLASFRNTTTYLKFIDENGEKKYVEIKPEVFGAAGADFNEIIKNLTFSSSEAPAMPTASKETVDGKEYDVYTFVKSTGKTVIFYADGENITELKALDADGNTVTHIVLPDGAKSLITTDIPGDMLTIKGYKETTVLALLPLL